MVLTLMLGVFLGQQAKAFYDPSVGRWLSRDSIGERGGKNLYDFVQNCPIGAIDGLGLVTGSFNVQFSTPQFGEGLVGWSVRFDWRPPSSWPLKCAPCEKAVWVQDYRFHSDFYWTFNWVNDWHIANYGGNSTPWVNGAWGEWGLESTVTACQRCFLARSRWHFWSDWRQRDCCLITE